MEFAVGCIVALVVSFFINTPLFAFGFIKGMGWFVIPLVKLTLAGQLPTWPIALGFGSFAGMFYRPDSKTDKDGASVSVVAPVVSRTLQILICIAFMALWSRFL